MPRVMVGWGEQSWPSFRELNLYVKLLNDDKTHTTWTSVGHIQTSGLWVTIKIMTGF